MQFVYLFPLVNVLTNEMELFILGSLAHYLTAVLVMDSFFITFIKITGSPVVQAQSDHQLD